LSILLFALFLSIALITTIDRRGETKDYKEGRG